MDSVKKVMVAVGFTEYSEGLLDYAAQVAKTLQAELLVVNVINVRDVDAIGSIAAMGYEVDSEHYVSGIKEVRQQTKSNPARPLWLRHQLSGARTCMRHPA